MVTTKSEVGPPGGGPIHVSVDATAVPKRPAGAGRYTLDLVHHLIKRDDVRVSVISRIDDGGRWLAMGCERVHAVAPRARPVRLLWEQTSLPRLLERMEADVHHGPHYTMPEGTDLPRAVTIHDLTVFDHPEWHQRSKVALFRRAIKIAATEADSLICVSQATADRLAELFQPKCPIRVVHHGVDHDRFRPTEPVGGFDERALHTLGVHRPYVLFVGTVEPRKDVPGLVKAFDLMRPAHEGLDLVVAGGKGWGELDLDAAVTAARYRASIKRLGYVEAELLPALIRRAAAVAYPSLEEGFGLPVLEALACGAPVVTTAGSAMEEVAAGGALTVASGDVHALAGALDMLVRGDALLSDRREQGMAVAAEHTWDRSAEGHVAAYRAALSHSGAAR